MGKIEKDKLIRMIRRHPILYNPYHKDYANIHKKCKVWNAVGLKFNESGKYPF